MKQIPVELNSTYIACLFLEVAGICLLVFAIYLIPFLLFHVIYKVPPFILSITWWLDTHGYTFGTMYIVMIFLPIFFLGLLCFFESKLLTERIEQSLLEKDDFSLANQVKTDHSGIGYAVLRIALFTGGIFVAIWLVGSFI
jgi:hypothetical protein